jgi:hypothetical protein
MLPVLELTLTIDPTRHQFKNAVASPALSNNIDAFENRRQQDRLRTGAESVS